MDDPAKQGERVLGLRCGYGTNAELAGFDREPAFDFVQIVGFLRGGEGGGHAAGGGASGAADAVDEVFGFFGHVVVDDVGDVGDIDAAGGDVGGDEDAVVSLSEAAQGGVALGLGAVAVDLDGVVSGALEAAGDAVGSMLGANEDEEAAVVRAEEVLEELLLFVDRDLKGLELDVGRGLEDRADFDADRVAEVVARDFADLIAEGRGVAEGLALAGEGRSDAADGGLEAHVEHAVHFVEDQDADAAEADEFALEVVLEASRGGDDEARAAADGFELRAFIEATADEGRGAAAAGEVAVGFKDLHGELARGQEDEGAGAFGHL